MTEMLIRYGEGTPVFDEVVADVEAAQEVQVAEDAARPTSVEEQSVTPPLAEAKAHVNPDARTWGLGFVFEAATPTAQQPAEQPVRQEFDTSTLAGARAAAQAALARYGVAPDKTVSYPWNARAVREGQRQTLLGRLGIKHS